MTFFHLSDLHIGLKLLNRSMEEDQRFVFLQIQELAAQHRPDVILIAGDIYDKAVPSAGAVALFDDFITGLTEASPDSEIMMISGNHDSAERINLFRSILNRHRIHMIGIPPQKPEDFIATFTRTDDFGRVNFYLLPFVRPSMVRRVFSLEENEPSFSYDETIRRLIQREHIPTEERNVLVSHQFYLPEGWQAEEMDRTESEIRTVGNIDQVSASVLAPFDYAALGHIHRPMNLGNERFRYCGTPMPCSVSEAGQQKGISFIELKEKGSLSCSVLPLKPLREIRVIKGSLSEVLTQGSSDYVSILLTDGAEEPDQKDRIRNAFPNLLEVRRAAAPAVYREMDETQAEEAGSDPFQLCCSFLPDLEEGERDLLQDVIRSVQEGEHEG